MDKFDKILKDAVEGYEAPYDPQAWANVSGAIGFDAVVKKAVEGYQAPYNPQAWANVSSQLSSNGGMMKWIIGSAAVITLLVGTVYFMQNEEQTQTNIVVTDNTTEPSTTTAELTIPKDDMLVSNGNPVDGHGNPLVVDPAMNDNGNNNSGNSSNGNNGTSNGNDGTTHTVSNLNGGDPTITNPVENNDPELVFVEPTVVTTKFNSRFNSVSLTECAGNEFIFTPEDMNQNAIYGWDFGDGTYSNAKVGTHKYTRSGNFVVSLTLKDIKSNKTLSTATLDVVVNPRPTTQFSWEKSNEIIPTVSFINLTEDAQIWAWDIKGMKTSTDNQFEYTFRKKGTYMVELTAENEFGCQTTVQKPIVIENDYNLFAPTAFSPDGDYKNDVFIPEALRMMDVNFTMVIYNKAGTAVYQTNNVNAPWDGTNMNDNSVATDGAYVWKVQFKNANGETEFYEGQVIIIR